MWNKIPRKKRVALGCSKNRRRYANPDCPDVVFTRRQMIEWRIYDEMQKRTANASEGNDPVKTRPDAPVLNKDGTPRKPMGRPPKVVPPITLAELDQAPKDNLASPAMPPRIEFIDHRKTHMQEDTKAAINVLANQISDLTGRINCLEVANRHNFKVQVAKDFDPAQIEERITKLEKNTIKALETELQRAFSAPNLETKPEDDWEGAIRMIYGKFAKVYGDSSYSKPVREFCFLGAMEIETRCPSIVKKSE